MYTPRRRRIGCWTAVATVVLAIVGLIRWWTAPIDIPRPQRPPEPADNPYDVYRSLAAYTAQIFRNDPMLSYAEQELFPSRYNLRLDRPELTGYLVRRMSPVRREYRRYLRKPCVVIMEYTPVWQFPELAEFRRWASIEALDIALAAQEGDYARAVENYQTVLILAEQIRTQGNMLHHLVGSAMQAVVNRRMSEILPLLPIRQCEQLVAAVREWEKYRVPPEQAIAVERATLLSLLHDLYAGKVDAMRAVAENRAVMRWNPRWLNLRRAARELNSYLRLAEKEVSKPVVQQKRWEPPPHPVVRLLMPVYEGLALSTAEATTRIRLLGCAAAVRAYRLKHGSYPATLSEAGVADLDKDPFTGGHFVYKPAEKGFLLYSVGKDGKDDGGWLMAERVRGEGDISLLPFMGRPRGAGGEAEKGEPVWLK